MLLGWTEPYVHAILAFLRDRLGLDLRLDAHWKHVTVLMLLFFCAVLRVSRMGGVILAATFAILLIWESASCLAHPGRATPRR